MLAFDGDLRLRRQPQRRADPETDFTVLLSHSLDEWGAHDAALEGLARAIRAGFERADTAEWEEQVEREVKGGTQVLLLRGTHLPQSAESGSVVVFDDITHLLQAQRDAAWAEVARRLAHEIKNPLTPIQLSAERLQHKLAPKLADADAEMLGRSTQTIVNQVMALKRMVDAFSQYARTPEPSMQELDINQLAREVLTLYESLGSSIRLELAPRLPPVIGDAISCG